MYFPEGSKIEQARKVTFEVMCGQETEPGSVLYICSSHPTYLCPLPLFWLFMIILIECKVEPLDSMNKEKFPQMALIWWTCSLILTFE